MSAEPATPVPSAHEDQGLTCPHCGHTGRHEVYDSRASKGTIKRRRKCQNCGQSFRTRERVEHVNVPVCTVIEAGPDTLCFSHRVVDIEG